MQSELHIIHETSGLTASVCVYTTGARDDRGEWVEFRVDPIVGHRGYGTWQEVSLSPMECVIDLFEPGSGAAPVLTFGDVPLGFLSLFNGGEGHAQAHRSAKMSFVGPARWERVYTQASASAP